MKNITITKENLLKAHSEGCDDTKKVLENLCPDEFEKKIEFRTDKIYAFKKGGEVWKVNIASGVYRAIPMKDSWDEWLEREKPEDLLSAITDKGFKVEEFDNQKDFFTWALKVIS